MEKTFIEQQLEGLQTADNYILKLINGIDMYFNYIKEDREEEANNLLSHIVEGIEWIIEIARLTKDVQKKNMDERTMDEYKSELIIFFNEGSIDEGYKVLDEKVLPLLREWNNIISKSISA
ncbi:hypothetical protein [Clostridium sp. C2-6-12]|uniref:hypothetical protein n=1 Tax=Clostridium sp. C2-6-12 TaxID=2698832 RepID=UPI00136FD126|nr:hypothetical protein [Clostridium sp. C2-6-12]